MTTGSWNRDNFINGTGSLTGTWTGVKWSRSWNGADRTLDVYPTFQYTDIFRTVLADREKLALPPERHRIRRTGWLTEPRPPKRARDVDHAYSMSERYLSDEFCHPTVPSNWADYPVMWLHSVPTWAPTSLLDANDQIRLVNKLREKLQGSDFNMSVFLGEGHQTLKLIGDSAIRIAKALHAVRRGDIAGMARSLLEGTNRAPLQPRHKWQAFKGNGSAKVFSKTDARTVASNWLEIQYGWRPLLEDTVACMEQLSHILNTPAQTSYKVTVRRESRTVRVSQVGYNANQTATAQSVRIHRRSLIARITESPSVVQMSGLLDPELVAWELLPFSFVADWFIPIGSWMEARALAGRLKGTFVTSDIQTGFNFTPRSKYFRDNNLRANYRGVDFTRSISTALKVPMPNFKGLAKAASWQHCANAVALVTGLATGAKPAMHR